MNIALIGGDERIIELAKLYAKEEKDIKIYGYEKYQGLLEKNATLSKNGMLTNKDQIVNQSKDIKTAVENAQIIISSIPFSKDGENIYAPYSEEKIEIENLFKNIQNKTLIAGSISNETIEKAEKNNIKVIDLMKQEELTVLNTIATAEGTISQIIQNTKYNIHGSKILILGFGRVAKVLAKKLQALDAKITCAARKEKDFAWMETLGFNKTNINILGENLKEYDIIINTVPHLVLDAKRLQKVNKETLLIDLASKPGGIDFEECKKQELQCIWALAIPGKVAPITSAKYIKNTIENIIKEGADN